MTSGGCGVRCRIPRRGAPASSFLEDRDDRAEHRRTGHGRELPHPGEVAGRDDGVRRQAVDLGLVEQQEDGSLTADAVVRALAVEPGLRNAVLVELLDPLLRALAQLVELAE